MFPKERRREIVEIVNSAGFATVDDLARRFAVSVDSIRKDLKALQREGAVRREYGGALRMDGSGKNEGRQAAAPVAQAVAKSRSEADAGRQSVALRAYLEISDGDAVFLGVSRTNLLLADLIASGDKRLIVTSNMIDVVRRLAKNPKVTTLATGGYLNVNLTGYTGPATISLLEPLLFSKAFVGTTGVDLKSSAVLAASVDDGRVNEQVLKNASYCFLLADAAKFGESSGYRFASINDFAAIITDASDRDVLERVAATGTPVLC